MSSLGGRINETTPTSISRVLLKVGVVIRCFSLVVVTRGSFTLQGFNSCTTCRNCECQSYLIV